MASLRLFAKSPMITLQIGSRCLRMCDPSGSSLDKITKEDVTCLYNVSVSLLPVPCALNALDLVERHDVLPSFRNPRDVTEDVSHNPAKCLNIANNLEANKLHPLPL